MSSTSNSLLTGIRKQPTALTRFHALSEAIASVKNKIMDLDKLDFKTLNTTCISYLNVVDPEINFLKSYSRYNNFQVPLEPDLNLLVVWLKLNSTAALIDSSGIKRSANRGRIAFMHGSPPLVAGIDRGYGGSSAVYLDGKNTWIDMPSFDALTIAGKPSGFTIPITIKPDDFAVDSQGGGTRRIISKRDDDSNALFAAIETNGDIVFHVKKGGTEYRVMWDGAGNVISGTRWGELMFIFTGSAASIVLNGVVKSTPSTYTTTETYPTDFDTDFHIGRSSSTTDNRFKGAIQEFRIYKKVLTTTEISNLFTNKLSISNIPLGSVAVCGHTFMPTPTGGFTAAGFTSQGFTKAP